MLSWEQHSQCVVAKLCMARGLVAKLRHYVPVTVLRNVCFGIVHSYLQYGRGGQSAIRSAKRNFRNLRNCVSCVAL